MKKVLNILLIIFGILIVIGLSIWVGFPSSPNFDRETVVLVGYILGFWFVVFGFMNYTDL